MRNWILVVIVVVLAVYGGVSYYFSSKLLYPHLANDEELKAEYGPISPDEVDLAVEDVQFQARGDDEITISAWWIETKRASYQKKAFILVHGANSNKKALTRYAPFFVSRGISALLIDLRGHGESSKGYNTFGDKERNDVMGAVDFLSEKGYAPEDDIGLFGLSMGATASYLAAMDLNKKKAGTVDILIFDSGIADVPSSIEFNSRKAVGGAVTFLLPGALITAWSRSCADYKDGSPIAHLDDIDIPILFVMHDMDEIVPYDEQVELYEGYKGPKEELKFEGLGHHRGHVEKKVEYEEAVDKFLKKYNF
ncbi:MAG: alpha/beta hydrolase [Deltaproteobacteria bacterium]|uniref:Alpha/beta hydrolase n=1 Tax=Candidatus Zymogenus saltonus TaxID=2844893 RepID=A0A9D8KGP7_9DELT|nr:alpha/beta hydrolase [Candidatus Zymogenus saltonus]